MELTLREQRRLRRLERIARVGRVWIYLLVATLLISLGITVSVILDSSLPNQKLWFRAWLVTNAVLFMALVYLQDTRFLIRIIRKFEQGERR